MLYSGLVLCRKNWRVDTIIKTPLPCTRPIIPLSMKTGMASVNHFSLSLAAAYLVILAGIFPMITAPSASFDRMYKPYEPPVKDCSLTHESRCLIRSEQTSSDRDMLRNIRQTLSLSMYIYEYVTLRHVARTTDNDELHKQLELPRRASELFRSGQKHYNNKGDDIYQTLATTMDKMDEQEEQLLKSMEVILLKDDVDDIKRSLVYGVVRDEQHKRLIVVFRGSKSKYDWMKNINFRQKRENNPVYGSFGSKAKDIYVHAGFAEALLSESRSSCQAHGAHHQSLDQSTFYEGTIKHSFSQDVERQTQRRLRYECILDVVRLYMQQGYSLWVSGHSLGGALATLFAFYAASDDTFTRNGPVTVYSFASPRVGDENFRGSFKHLETRGRLRHARIHNHSDKVALVPLSWQSYKHVGIDIQLFRGNEPPMLDYPSFRGWGQHGPRLLKNIRTLPEVLQLHSTQLMMHRVHQWERLFGATTLENEYLRIWNRR